MEIEKLAKAIQEKIEKTIASKSAQILASGFKIYGHDHKEDDEKFTVEDLEKVQHEVQKMAEEHITELRMLCDPDQQACNKAEMERFCCSLNGHTKGAIEPAHLIHETIFKNVLAMQNKDKCLEGTHIKVANEMADGKNILEQTALKLCRENKKIAGELYKILNGMAAAGVSEMLIANLDIPAPADDLSMTDVSKMVNGARLAALPNKPMFTMQIEFKKFCTENKITESEIEGAQIDKALGMSSGAFMNGFVKANKSISNFLANDPKNELIGRTKAKTKEIEEMNDEAAAKYKKETCKSDFEKHEVDNIRYNKKLEKENETAAQTPASGERTEEKKEPGTKFAKIGEVHVKNQILHRAFYQLWKSAESLVRMWLGGRQMVGYLYMYLDATTNRNKERKTSVSFDRWCEIKKRGDKHGINVTERITPIIMDGDEKVFINNLDDAEVQSPDILMSQDEYVTFTEIEKEIAVKDKGTTKEQAAAAMEKPKRAPIEMDDEEEEMAPVAPVAPVTPAPKAQSPKTPAPATPAPTPKQPQPYKAATDAEVADILDQWGGAKKTKVAEPKTAEVKQTTETQKPAAEGGTSTIRKGYFDGLWQGYLEAKREGFTETCNYKDIKLDGEMVTMPLPMFEILNRASEYEKTK